MRILFLISSPTLTGPAAPMLLLARRLREAGADLAVACDACRPGDLEAVAVEWDLPLFQGLALSRVARPDRYLADALRLSRWLSRGWFDVLVAAETNDAVTAAAANLLTLRDGVLLRYLPAPSEERRRLSDRLLNRCLDGLIVPRSPWADAWAARRPFAAHSVFALPPDIDRDRFQPPTPAEREDARRRFGFGANDRVVGTVGRVKAGRGQLELIRALARIAPVNPNLKLLLVGWGEDLPLCRWLAGSLGVAGRVRFPGFLDEELPDAYHAMDAFILPAVGRDGVGRAALEAMACGLPVWTVEHPVAAGLVREAAAGDVFAEPSIEALSAALADMASRGDLATLGENGRRAIDALDPANVARDFLRFLKRLRLGGDGDEE